MKNYLTLCVSSSISIYKSLDLLSLLKKKNIDSQVVLSQRAKKMISPMLFSAMSHHKVFDDSSEYRDGQSMAHIDIAKNSSLIVYYPASANLIGKLANGIADDLITTTSLVAKCAKVIFPAMNPNMWHHPAVQANVKKLSAYGYYFIGPEEGEVACGDEGLGKLSSPESALQIIKEQWTAKNYFVFNSAKKGLKKNKQLFLNKKVIITAGGSIEDIDPVRYLSNKSTGKMGKALADYFIAQGAIVTYLYGNISSPRPDCQCLSFSSTLDLLQLLEKNISQQEILIMAAAPADYRVENSASEKIKTKKKLTLTLIPNPDILSHFKKHQLVKVGFAAETSTDEAENFAQKKLLEKELDLIVLNQVGKDTKYQKVFGTDETNLKLISKDSNPKVSSERKEITKKEAAALIGDEILKIIKKG